MIKISVAQISFEQKNNSRLNLILRYIQLAKKRKIDLVCFPEGVLKQGAKKNEILIQKISNECKINKVACIVVGNLKEKNKIYNTALLIDSDGKIKGKHKKVFVCDDPKVSAGNSFQVYSFNGIKIGLAICWDINHPKSLTALAKKGADIVFCPMYWNHDKWSHPKNPIYHEKKILESLVLTRAYENLIYVAFCNAYNHKSSSLVSFSAIAEPHKILKTIFNKEGMIDAKVDLKYLNGIRKNYRKDYGKII